MHKDSLKKTMELIGYRKKCKALEREVERLKNVLVEKHVCPNCIRDLKPFYSRDADAVLYTCETCEEYYE